MANSSTPANGGSTESRIRDARIAGWAYAAGVEAGIAQGVIRAMTPDAKNRGEFRRQQIASLMREYANNAQEIITARKWARYWPDIMPGGWPKPDEFPSDDESTYWPEVDGWPCPPPSLRGPSVSTETLGRTA